MCHGFQVSQQTRICRLAAAPLIFVGAFLEKSSGLCSRAEASRAEAGQSSEDHACGTEGKPAAFLQSSHLLPAILCLQSDFCVSPHLFHESPPKAEAAVTHAGTAVPCLECSWIDWHLSASESESICIFKPSLAETSQKKPSIIQHYSIALIIIQILFLGSFASSQVCTGA